MRVKHTIPAAIAAAALLAPAGASAYPANPNDRPLQTLPTTAPGVFKSGAYYKQPEQACTPAGAAYRTSSMYGGYVPPDGFPNGGYMPCLS